VTRRLPAEAV